MKISKMFLKTKRKTLTETQEGWVRIQGVKKDNGALLNSAHFRPWWSKAIKPHNYDRVGDEELKTDWRCLNLI